MYFKLSCRTVFAIVIAALLSVSLCAPTTSETLVTSQVISTPSEVAAGGATYQITPSSTPTNTPSIQNKLGTYLYGYNGCDSGQKGKINDAYYDAWKISNLDGVHANIDWNEAPALDFLGAPGLNKPRQGQIQAVFANMATIMYSNVNPFQHAIHVRCDDPLKRCDKRPKDDHCQPEPHKPDDKAGNEVLPNAYATNNGGDGYPLINFCEGFMSTLSLPDSYTYGSSLPEPDKFRIDRYKNRATIFFHELLHLDVAADSFFNSPNPSIKDVTIVIKVGTTGRFNVKTKAYGGLRTKLLARYQDDPGYFVQQNADNLAFFALAKYVMSKNGNIYPHIPLIVDTIEGPPWIPPGASSQDVASFANDTAGVYLDVANTAFGPLGMPDFGDYPTCSDDLDSDDQKAIIIDGLVPSSAYPSSYNDNIASWLNDLAPMTSTVAAPPATTTPPPPPPPPSSTPPPPAGDICGDWYHFLFDHFEIYGKNFDAAKFGTDGSGLKQQIQGCGDLTSWTYDKRTDDPNGYQWFATGSLPIGTKACVGRAVVSAGGASADGCTGAG